jgi:hypothetical protein
MPAAKDPRSLSRARDARRQRPWVVLEGGAVEPPPLRNARRLHPATRRWWRAWVAFGVGAGFIATDWLSLELLARSVEEFHRTNDVKLRVRLAREIRLGEKRLQPRRPPIDDEEGPAAA